MIKHRAKRKALELKLPNLQVSYLVLFLQSKKGTNLCTVSTQFPFVLMRDIVNGGWSRLLNWLIAGMLLFEMTV